MLIGIEAERANHPQKTGVEHYAKQLILHLAKLDSKNNYILYLRTQPQEWFLNLPKNFKIKVMPFPLFWTQVRISLEMLLHPVDVLMIPASALSIIHPKKSIVTIHDIAWKFFPKSFTRFNRMFLDISTNFAVDNAAKVITVSASTKRDLFKYYHVGLDKIVVVHHGYDKLPSPYENILNLPKKYVLFLSTLQPRKNLPSLISAFRQLKNEDPNLPHKLVVAGKRGWLFEDILKTIEANKDIVIYLDHVSDSQRYFLLSNADLMVLPSLYEGFGMQILEAFEAGCPVAASNISSMPEVAGDAAEYFDPKNISQIKNAIKNVLTNDQRATQLREKGKIQLEDFSWEKAARKTLALLTTNESD
ncbi:MAG: hypothetical protein COT92_02840 [Candidatus Doudnabacteria bacterium CG10_big_fil_rev_8_21_14_0_10_42_18]|uniref:Glycosyltransferase family 1 protein n=1 Tax=Candidatus Doudnabacteria bacterium CG10_big_fil_rev_8_21_14_0_10_42_18 TaxID=1974552 RepID=A0A2H0VAI3_9BACT|nr:MAG: hypothetical protein COT92_02840 [Candidatus Doudnabacteria bacterium CG10_big_fil_rev_8_21_14_0_10_42_18]